VAEPLIDRWIRRQRWMDGFAETIQKVIGWIYGVLGAPGRLLEDLMHGTKVLGHPLHPAITDIPMGAWAVAVVADYAAHFTNRLPTEAGDVALAVALATALLAVLTGYTDFRHTFAHERRVALTHGLIMSAAVTLGVVSMALRWWSGSAIHPLAVGLSTAGLGLLIVGGYFGGHLVFGLGSAVNRNAFAEGSDDFVAVGVAGDFAEGTLTRVVAAGMPVLVVRKEGELHAIGAVCSHAGGPLDEGTLNRGVITCPWHGSRFCITNGKVKHGPATFRQPVFVVREINGNVAVKPEVPLH
jgi:nitrite reductase/ring-hydroxylating ferredoxin subunit/uncharacterized membrane protein